MVPSISVKQGQRHCLHVLRGWLDPCRRPRLCSPPRVDVAVLVRDVEPILLRVVEKHPPVPSGAVRLLPGNVKPGERRASIHLLANRYPILVECVDGIERSSQLVPRQGGHRIERLTAVVGPVHPIRGLFFPRLGDGEDLAAWAAWNRKHPQHLLRGSHLQGPLPVRRGARGGVEQAAFGARTQGAAAGRQPEDEKLLRLGAGGRRCTGRDTSCQVSPACARRHMPPAAT